jgi:hypothetical protein
MAGKNSSRLAKWKINIKLALVIGQCHDENSAINDSFAG